MAGSPIQKIAPYVKKYALELYIALGFVLYAKMKLGDRKTYRTVYGENDFKRRYVLDKIDEYLDQEQKKSESEVEVVEH